MRKNTKLKVMKRYLGAILLILLPVLVAFAQGDSRRYIGFTYSYGYIFQTGSLQRVFFEPRGLYFGRNLKNNLYVEVGALNYTVADADQTLAVSNYDGFAFMLDWAYDKYFGKIFWIRPFAGILIGNIGQLYYWPVGEQTQQVPLVETGPISNQSVLAPEVGLRIGLGKDNRWRMFLLFNAWYDLSDKTMGYIYNGSASGQLSLSGFRYTLTGGLELPLTRKVVVYGLPKKQYYLGVETGVINTGGHYLVENSDYVPYPASNLYAGARFGVDFKDNFGLQIRLGTYRYQPWGFSQQLYRWLFFNPGYKINTAGIAATYQMKLINVHWTLRLIAGVNAHFATVERFDIPVTTWQDGYFQAVNKSILAPFAGLNLNIKIWKRLYFYVEMGYSFGKKTLVAANYTDNDGTAYLPYNGSYLFMSYGLRWIF